MGGAPVPVRPGQPPFREALLSTFGSPTHEARPFDRRAVAKDYGRELLRGRAKCSSRPDVETAFVELDSWIPRYATERHNTL